MTSPEAASSRDSAPRASFRDSLAVYLQRRVLIVMLLGFSSGLPLALYVANGRASSGQTKFVLGLGEASVAEALNPSSTLAGSSTSSTAAATLGEGIQPSVIFQVPTLLGLLEGVGLGEDPTLAPVLPLLRGVSTITAGGRTSGGIERFKVVLGLAGAG